VRIAAAVTGFPSHRAFATELQEGRSARAATQLPDERLRGAPTEPGVALVQDPLVVAVAGRLEILGAVIASMAPEDAVMDLEHPPPRAPGHRAAPPVACEDL
jgi:hypothetical protein